MKKLIHTCLITVALVSTAASAGQSEASYACKVMMERGSAMFCDQGTDATPKLAISDVMPASKDSYACNAMVENGSSMFCKEGGSIPGSQISNN
ncbi:hypothetical protein ACFL3U_02380 [Pseudomonadota bacterium]